MTRITLLSVVLNLIGEAVVRRHSAEHHRRLRWGCYARGRAILLAPGAPARPGAASMSMLAYLDATLSLRLRPPAGQRFADNTLPHGAMALIRACMPLHHLMRRKMAAASVGCSEPWLWETSVTLGHSELRYYRRIEHLTRAPSPEEASVRINQAISYSAPGRLAGVSG